MAIHIRRREFIFTLGGAAAAWPLAARAQQPAMPVIGFLDSRVRGHNTLSIGIPPGPEGSRLRRGPERRNRISLGGGPVRSAAGARGRFGRRQVAVIVAGDCLHARLAAKAATSTIPIVFISGGDPITGGLVTSLSRPGGNITGVTFRVRYYGQSAWGCCMSWMPRQPPLLVLGNPINSPSFEIETRDVEAAARELGQ